jgi:hypothetical protein
MPGVPTPLPPTLPTPVLPTLPTPLLTPPLLPVPLLPTPVLPTLPTPLLTPPLLPTPVLPTLPTPLLPAPLLPAPLLAVPLLAPPLLPAPLALAPLAPPPLVVEPLLPVPLLLGPPAVPPAPAAPPVATQFAVPPSIVAPLLVPPSGATPLQSGAWPGMAVESEHASARKPPKARASTQRRGVRMGFVRGRTLHGPFPRIVRTIPTLHAKAGVVTMPMSGAEGLDQVRRSSGSTALIIGSKGAAHGDHGRWSSGHRRSRSRSGCADRRDRPQKKSCVAHQEPEGVW